MVPTAGWGSAMAAARVPSIYRPQVRTLYPQHCILGDFFIEILTDGGRWLVESPGFKSNGMPKSFLHLMFLSFHYFDKFILCRFCRFLKVHFGSQSKCSELGCLLSNLCAAV